MPAARTRAEPAKGRALLTVGGLEGPIMVPPMQRTTAALRVGFPLLTIGSVIYPMYRLLEQVELTDVTRSVLRRASEAFPTPLGTFDAIHLATAIMWRDGHSQPVAMAVHDKSLGTAARAVGFDVVGV